jgi:acetolactate synthase I/III small subunit
VIKILELEPGEAVERELVLVKVRAQGDARARVIEIADIFRARVLDVTSQTATIEATGTADKLEALLRLLDDFGIVELARTGRVALARGERGIRERVLRAAGAAAAPVERGSKRTKPGEDDEEYTGGGV